MIAKRMINLVEKNSVIREMFEEGKKLSDLYGPENVFDFSLGNPSVPAPEKVKESIKKIVDTEDPLVIHGYMNNAGFEDVRDAISKSINKKYGTNFTYDNLIMTVGAASGLNIILKSILNPNEEVLTFAPYFVEYNSYVEGYGGKLKIVSPNLENFEPNLKELEEKITPNTRALIINTPNNPTGVIYSEETIKEIAEILNKKQKQYNTQIFLISDEPYRELAYDGIEVPYVTKYYKNTFVVYSFSKSLSLPGERIGYVVVPSEMDDSENIITAITIANRVIGSVNAPSLLQKVVMNCLDISPDLETYDRNRNLLYNELKNYGFECIKPQGAFYLFVKSPIEDEKEFCNIAKKYNILFVPVSSFACPGYVRIAYCVSTDMIKRSLPKFKLLAEETIK